MKRFGICSECKEHCEILADDGTEIMEGPSGRLVKTAVRQPEYVSNCCYAPVLDPTGPEVDEVEVPGGHRTYITACRRHPVDGLVLKGFRAWAKPNKG